MAVTPEWLERWAARQTQRFAINPHNDIRPPRDNRPGLPDLVKQLTTVGENLGEIYPGGTGLQPPEVTTAERDAIPAPVPGTIVWNSDTVQLENWNGVAWVAVAGGGGGAVTSVFGRVGAVVAAVGDYAGSEVTNDSGVAGATVSDALDTLAGAAAPVTSVFGRTGAVVAAAGDYDSTEVTNASGVAGATVTAALNTLNAASTSPVKPPVIDTFDLSGLDALAGSGRSNAVSGQAVYYPIVVPTALTVSALQTRVINITGGSTWSLSLGIYNYDDATRTPSTRVFFGTVTGIVAAADISITTFTGSPALSAGRYFFAALPVLTAGAGNLRRLIPNDLDDSAFGIAVNQLRLESALASLPASATSAAFTPGTQAFWHRALVSLP